MSRTRNYHNTEDTLDRQPQSVFSDMYGRASKKVKSNSNNMPRPYEADTYSDFEADDDYYRRNKNYEDEDYNDDYDDEGYEDYGELGSNFSPSDDPN